MRGSETILFTARQLPWRVLSVRLHTGVVLRAITHTHSSGISGVIDWCVTRNEIGISCFSDPRTVSGTMPTSERPPHWPKLVVGSCRLQCTSVFACRRMAATRSASHNNHRVGATCSSDGAKVGNRPKGHKGRTR